MKRYELAALIGRAAIIDGQLNRVSPVGLGFVWSPNRGGFHRGDYSMEDARTVVDWMNGQDRHINLTAREADATDPVHRIRSVGPSRRGLEPLPANLPK